MAPTTEGIGGLWDYGGPLEPLDSFLNPGSCSDPHNTSLVLGGESDLFLAEGAADWLAGDLAAQDVNGHIGGAPCQPASCAAVSPSLLPAGLPPGQPQLPAARSSAALPQSHGLAAAGTSAEAASRVADGQHLFNPLLRAHPQPVDNSLQQQQQPLTGAVPRKQRGRGRPRADRSQMTEQQLRAIAYTEAHNERKKNHMRDLEERVAELRVNLERERAQQDDSQQSVAALERLLNYKDEMVAVLRETGQEAAEACRDRTADGTSHCPLCNTTGGCSHGSMRSETSPVPPLGLCDAPSLLPANSWADKLPATWQYVEAVLRGRGEPPAPLGRSSVASATSATVSLPPSLQQHLPQLRRLGQQQPLGFQLHCWKGGCPDWRAICDSASPAVVTELQSASAADFVQGWRDYAQDARDILTEFNVTKNESKAVSQLTPYIAMLAVLMNLAMHHNPGCMKQLFMTSAENLSQEQQREKYDGLVAALDMDPLQQGRYQELAEAYTTFVQRARQHKAEALARIGQSAFSSLPASASMGRMVSQYLKALDATAVLSAYPDAELIALLELIRGHGKILKPLQKATVAAVAYPHFPDLVQIVEAVRRLPSPQQQERLLDPEPLL